MQNCTTILGIIDMRQRGISYDDCRSRYHIGCSTISLIMSRFHACGKDLNSLKQMSAEEVEHLFFPPENLRRKDDSVMPDYQMVYDRLTAPGSKANLFYLWLKYKKECPSGYQYTQYCLHFKRFVEKNYGSEAVSMVVERIPGEKVYIDWIGDQPEILMDSITGELKKVHFFVTTVGVSNLVYAEAFEDEKLPNFIAGTVHALESYGALPKYLVPDNLKTAITRHTKDELVINSAYQDLESFYDIVILPPPPRKPKGKPTVEKYVQFLETHLLEDLKEKVYYSIEDINRFTKDDVVCALEMFNEDYVTFPRDDIAKISGLTMPVNKRNWRKQEQHLRLARGQLAILRDMGEAKQGRPVGSGTAQERVSEWRQKHPEGRKADCHRDTGLDPKTIRKWWGDISPM
mgnify:CR=1 FL=1